MRRTRLRLRLIDTSLVVVVLISLMLIGWWVRGCFWLDIASYNGTNGNASIWCTRGNIAVELIQHPDTRVPTARWGIHLRVFEVKGTGYRHPSWWRRYGINWVSGPMDNPARGDWHRLLYVPIWLPILFCGLLPAWLLRRARRRALANDRIGQGLCPACGYDLRATPERCPECGREVAAADGKR